MDKGIAKDIFEFYFDDESMIDKKHVKEAIKWQTARLKKAKKRIKKLEVLLCPCECEDKQEEPNKLDLSILNENDWFYVETMSGFKFICKGFPDARNKGYDLKYGCFYENRTTGSLLSVSELRKLRKATKEEIRDYIYKNDPTLIPEDFTDWWVGQKVWSTVQGEGIVENVPKDCSFTVDFKGIGIKYYTNGKELPDEARIIYPYPVEVIKKQNK